MPDDDPDTRDDLAKGVDHLQAAAREMIRAGRSLLDAAEGLVDDPAALRGALGTFTNLAQVAVRRFGVESPADDPDGDGDGGKVERINLR